MRQICRSWRNELTVETHPDRRAPRRVLSWPATTREDWLAALVCEQFVLRPRVRKEARKMHVTARWG